MSRPINYVSLALVVIVAYESGKDYLRTQGINNVYEFVDSTDFSFLKDQEDFYNA